MIYNKKTVTNYNLLDLMIVRQDEIAINHAYTLNLYQ